MKTVPAFAFILAGLTVASSAALAQNDTSTTHHAVKKAHTKKAVAKKSAHAAQTADPELNVKGLQATDFDCELGNKLTIYRKPGDDQHIALRWHKHLHELTRIQTTTGANRFENATSGLVWIGIPTKSMLLDSKKGQQLANECRDAEQRGALHPVSQIVGAPH